jgi:hypothetical protein
MAPASWLHNEAYADALRQTTAAHPAVGSAAREVLQRFAAFRSAMSYNPRHLVSPSVDNQRPGDRIEDALAALTILEQRDILEPPSTTRNQHVWKLGDMDAHMRIAPFTVTQWGTAYERYWALLCEYLPSYHRTVHLTCRMLAQLIALGGGDPHDEARARTAFAHWARQRQLRAHVTVYGTVAFANPVRQRERWRSSPADDAHWLRDNLSRRHPLIQVTAHGAVLLGAHDTSSDVGLAPKDIENALAYDAARPYESRERLVAQRTARGMCYVTLAALVEHNAGPRVVEALTALAASLGADDLSARLQGISNPIVRDAAVDEAEHVAETLCELARWCGQRMPADARTPASVLRDVERLAVSVRACRTAVPQTERGVRNAGVDWTRGLAAVAAMPGIPRTLTRGALSDVLPMTAWAYPNVQPRLHPLYSLLSPEGVRPSALVLAAHRYHPCAVTRADARISLAECHRLQTLIDASVHAHLLRYDGVQRHEHTSVMSTAGTTATSTIRTPPP